MRIYRKSKIEVCEDKCIVELTRGHKAIADIEDYDKLIGLAWFAVVGSQIRAARQRGLSEGPRGIVYMHHQILGFISPPDGREVDHIDGNPLNNRRSNLRLVTHTENMLNTNRHKNRVGMCFNHRSHSWIVYLDSPGEVRKYLGYRKTRKEAEELLASAK